MIRASLKAAQLRSVPTSNRFSVLASLPTNVIYAPSSIQEVPTNSEHFHVPITLGGRHKSKEVTAMIDSGASTLFINKKFVEKYNVKTQKLKQPNIDGTPNRAGFITEMAVLTTAVGEHKEKSVFTVTDIGPEDVIIGIDWLRYHNPNIDWFEGLITMDGCPDDCPAKAALVRSELVHRGDTEVWLMASLDKLRKERVKPKRVVKKATVVPLEPDNDDEPAEEQSNGPSSFNPDRLAELQAKASTTQIGGKGTPRHMLTPQSEPLVKEGERLFCMAGYTYSTELALKENAQKLQKTFEEMVPEQYRDFASVFSEAESQRLPEHKSWDHAIELVLEAKGFHAKVYPLAKNEQEELDKFLDKNLKKGYIRVSKLPISSPFFFVKKKDGGLRPVQDYRCLNEMTIKNRYPLPLISELMDRLKGAKYFTKLDVRWGYNNVQIKEGDEYKAAFVTNRGLYEPTVMFFGLTNSPATIQNVMNDIFADLIAEGKVTVYLDDILIFSRDLDEHRRVVREVLRRLKEHNLFLKPSKCEFE